MNREQKKIYDRLVESLDYDKVLVLKAIKKFPNAGFHTIHRWCHENEAMFDFEEGSSLSEFSEVSSITSSTERDKPGRLIIECRDFSVAPVVMK